MKKTLVVGGEAAFVNGTLRENLATHGLDFTYHWEWKKAAGSLPDDTEVIYILTDMAGHYLNDAAKDGAAKRSLPVIMGVRKYAIAKQRLINAGFPEIIMPKPTVTLFPALTHAPRSRSLKGEARELYEKFLPVLAASPSLSNRALANHFNSAYGSTGEPARSARDTLGIVDVDGGRAVSLSRNVYDAACKALGVSPVLAQRLEKQFSVAEASPVVASTLASAVTAAPVITPAPVVIENATVTFTPSPVPMPVPVPVPAPKPAAPALKPTDEMQEFRDLVNLLRSEMIKRNITKLVVTPESVDATKVITVNESLGF